MSKQPNMDFWNKITAVPKRYKVYRVYRNNARKQIIETGLSLEEAQRLVQSFPDRDDSMVVFTEQKRSK